MFDSLADVHPRRPVVYVGPSIDPSLVRQQIPSALVLPPVKRGDLYAARERGAGAFLMIDGVFAHTFAVSPREVVDVLRDGAQVVGASSMGALRAADCHPAGMIGVGLIYRLFRLGVLTTDDEVAVATDPRPPFPALSTALINTRYSLAVAVRRGCLTRERAEQLLATARNAHFSTRDHVTLMGSHSAIAESCPYIDLKRRDAQHAINYLRRNLHELTTAGVRTTTGPLPRPERYVGHDRFVGSDPDEVKVAVTKWLWSTGRYQRYLWPLLSGEPAVAQIDASPGKRPQQLRQAASGIMSSMLANLTALAERVFAELEFLEEADSEIMRWHAVHRLAEAGESAGLTVDPATLAHVRDELAVLHGFRAWNLLVERIANGLLWGSIPFDWIDEACKRWAMARTYTHRLQKLPAST